MKFVAIPFRVAQCGADATIASPPDFSDLIVLISAFVMDKKREHEALLPRGLQTKSAT